ncbi:DUF5606 domain-containing protein [Flavobacterium sp. HJJ]|uniref:DUF5606 family protein n=1 Tax=Flavobacterium sp. HJJ TaxID=2783792 RepID=UPI00188A01E2|nr:DUF5606 domain-containing protein [Flavobacterium sp. HJJ]MBF4472492.1 DUF5606 domain-containing protein [Flavobacterium sp. HJJ]
MSLEKILSISGKPGLYVLKVQTRTGFVAESLLDGKKVTVSLKSNVSLLSEISIYTYEGEKPLAEIIQNIAKKENNGQTISHKEDNTALLTYFREVLPEYDEERVYASDVKKIVSWYNTLQAKGLLAEEALVAAEETAPAAEEAAAEKVKAPAKKAPAKKAAAKKE